MSNGTPRETFLPASILITDALAKTNPAAINIVKFILL